VDAKNSSVGHAGCSVEANGQLFKELLQTPDFRICVVNDPNTVEICGALKVSSRKNARIRNYKGKDVVCSAHFHSYSRLYSFRNVNEWFALSCAVDHAPASAITLH